MWANVPSVGRTCGVSKSGASLSQGIGAGCSTRSTYKGDEMYTSERLTGTSKVALTALSRLSAPNKVSIITAASEDDFDVKLLSEAINYREEPRKRGIVE